MKKLFLTLFFVSILSACGSFKTYNSALKQIELGMTKQEVVSLMGTDYVLVSEEMTGGKLHETIEYRDMYKNHWFFEFVDDHLNKWYKRTEGK